MLVFMGRWFNFVFGFACGCLLRARLRVWFGCAYSSCVVLHILVCCVSVVWVGALVFGFSYVGWVLC